jgi:hypothetical protein
VHPEWVVGVADDVWWSRLAHPPLHAWTASEPRRLGQHVADPPDPAPQARACDGLGRVDTTARLIRFVDGRPGRHVTTPCLGWLAQRLAAEGQQARVGIWDTASWHVSRAVRTGLQAHNQRVKRASGGRRLRCQLPSQSPWLHRLEPQWVHGKRAIAAPTRKLTGKETPQRLCHDDQCELLDPLAQPVA